MLNKNKIRLKTNRLKNFTESKNLASNDKISGLVSELYTVKNKLKGQHVSDLSLIEEKIKSRKHISATKELFLENADSVRRAKLQENKLKKKVVLKPRNVKSDLGISYSDMYKKYKTQMSEKELFELPEYEMPEVKEGIMYYGELKDRPAILEYTLGRKKKVEKIKKERLEKEKNELDFLGFLQKKKKNNSEALLKNPEILRKWERQSYETKIKQIQNVRKQLRKVYCRHKKRELSSSAKEMIEQSPILKEQERILDDIDRKKETGTEFSQQNKEELKLKFSKILHELARSLPEKRVKENTILTSRIKEVQLTYRSLYENHEHKRSIDL